MTEKSSQHTSDLQPDLTITWHDKTIEDIYAEMGTSSTEGLTDDQVNNRQEKFGMNELMEKPRPSFFQLLFSQLNNFIVILLLISSIISALLNNWIGAGVIILIVILNAILGVVQESKAEEALAALKKMSAPECQVLRKGVRVSVPARELVPGDIVYLEAGNYVPADIRLVESINLRVEEAALTGESVPVQKNAAILVDPSAALGDRKNSVFSGTLVNYGRGHGIVVSTGMKTQIGMIAGMLQTM
jgi:Ca2+-transporting ATPase